MTLPPNSRLNLSRRSAAPEPCFEVGDTRHRADQPGHAGGPGRLWFAATHFGWASPLFLPSPAEVAPVQRRRPGRRLCRGTCSPIRGQAWGGSPGARRRHSLGIPLGLPMGLNRWVKGVFSVPIDLYWGLPPLAYLPLLIIWLGIGETSKIVLLTLRPSRRSAFPPRPASAPFRASASTPHFRWAGPAGRSSPASCCPRRCRKS